uniref:Cytochrome b5 heme-binding domain-containing protein n=1 Tax=Ananas comosus var. bracteatus TaxID=296719 RepID=A0A6V7PDS4_ANACO|nr:unnamed protein product [Ananas comosus var. bracteatus]
MGLYAALAEAIDAYTGLSPAAFSTILALMVAAYFLVSSMFVHPDALPEKPSSASHPAAPAMAPPPPYVPAEPVQVGDITAEELRAYDGSDPKKPLLMAIKGNVYDVSPGRLFYGPGGPYALFAGKECSRALALLSFDPRDINGNLEGLNEAELDVLQDWEEKFKEKYAKVGQIVHEHTKAECNGSSEQTESNVDTHAEPSNTS